jgi:WD40 repeat protein
MEDLVTMRLLPNPIAALSILLSLAHTAHADPLAILRDQCLECHNQTKRKGGYLLSTRQGALKGGDTGKAIDLEKPAESLLLELLTEKGDPHMPPKKQLKPEEIASLRKWVEDGAPWDAAIMEALPERKPVAMGALPSSRKLANAVAIAPDGKRVAVARGNQVLLQTMDEKVLSLDGDLPVSHTANIQSLAWSQDGKLLAAGSFRKVTLLEIGKTEPQKLLEDKIQGRVTALQFLNDGQRLVIADSLPTQLGLLHIYRMPDGIFIKTIRAHTDTIYSLSASSDGELLASASADKLARLWNAQTLQPAGTLEGHTAYVLSATFSPDSKRVATTSADSSIKIWDAKSLNEDISYSPRNFSHAINDVVWVMDPAKEKPGEKDDWLLTISDDNVPRVLSTLVNHEGAQTSNGAKERSWPVAGTNGSMALDWSPVLKRATITDGDGKLHFLDANGKPWVPETAPEEAKDAEIAKPTIGFRSDILPILSKAGCAEGSCHAKSGGQNGFQLSIFAFDPKADHFRIQHAAHARRTFPAAPEHSLLLLKATDSIPHEGGQRIKKGSPFYSAIRDWIAQGSPYTYEHDPILSGIQVDPPAGQSKKETKFGIKVTASFSDGSTRNVTHLSHFLTSEKVLADVDEEGHVQLGKHTGEAILTVRYVDKVAISRVTIPTESLLPASAYAELPVHNEIDRLNYARHKELGLLISPPCTDSEFIRRASLDTTGKLPHPDTVQKFLADESPDKRDKYIEKLLADPDWADHWATRFNDLFRPNTQRVGVKPVYLLDKWIRRKLRENTPWDQFTREMLTASGSTHQYGPVAIFRHFREPETAGAFTSRIFLGLRLECAQCHHHPSEKWGQDDYYQLAAFYGSMKRKGQGISPPISGEPEYWWFQPGGEVKHPVTQATMRPKPPDGEFLEIPEGQDPRTALVDWMVSKGNPFFSKAITNRIWGEFFGIGIVEPVDDFRESNPPSDGPLLDWLAKDYTDHGYDLKHLMRRILRSRTYQTSSLPNGTNAADHKNFARSLRRRLTAEVMSDAVTTVTDIAESFDGLPERAKAKQVWNTTMNSTFLDTFGRPDPSAECPCERDPAPTITQTLHLANSQPLTARIALPASRATRLAKSDKTPEQITQELYLTAFARHPTDSELQTATQLFTQEGATRQTATEDLLWALLNTAEFVLNH